MTDLLVKKDIDQSELFKKSKRTKKKITEETLKKLVESSVISCIILLAQLSLK